MLSDAVPQTLDTTGAVVARAISRGTGPDAFAVLFRATGDELEPLARLHRGETTTAFRTEAFGGTVEQPVDEATLWRPHPDGHPLILLDRPLPTGHGDATGRITIISIRGDTLRSFALTTPARAIPRAAAERAVERQAECYSRLLPQLPLSPREFRETVAEVLAVPAYQSPFDRLVVAREGTIWLREGAFELDAATWRAFTLQGRPGGTVRLPTDEEVLAIDADRLWTAARGE